MIITKNNFIFGISEKKDGSMKDDLLNKKEFLKQLDELSNKKLASAKLIDGNIVKIVDKADEDVIMANCDALISQQSNVILSITVADCLPIYFYDSKNQVIAIAHAGWRGALQEVAPRVIKIFCEKYRSKSTDINIYIGPHIQNCHFEVQTDVLEKFKNIYSYAIIDRDNKSFIDLSLVVKNQLINQGVLEKNIIISPECTYCQKEKYFSYRRDKPQNLQTMLAFISKI